MTPELAEDWNSQVNEYSEEELYERRLLRFHGENLDGETKFPQRINVDINNHGHRSETCFQFFQAIDTVGGDRHRCHMARRATGVRCGIPVEGPSFSYEDQACSSFAITKLSADSRGVAERFFRKTRL